VVFTSGGTESDNLAVKGITWSRRAADPARDVLLVGAAEHHAVLDAAHFLADHQGVTVVPVPVDAAGRVTPDALAAVLAAHRDRAALVSTMWANNEVGTVTPIAELAAVAAEAGVPLHTDAVQALGAVPVDFGASGAAAMTVTGHKIGGPVGVGALLLRTDVACTPVLHGGGQERDVRSGTLDVAGVAALAAAVDDAASRQQDEARRLTALRDDLVARVRAAVPDAVLNGDPVDRLPGNAHFSFPGCEGDALLMLLDAAGVECSTGSACSAGVAQPSHVLLAMGADGDRARSSLRFSLGHTSTAADVTALLDALPAAVDRARRATAVSRRR
jgi:cysteine desulfurase